MHDILRESPFLQEMLQEGREEGIQEGKLEGQREAVLAIIQARFPTMAHLAKKLVTDINDSASLQDVIVKISMAQTDEEVQQYLLEGIEKSGN